MIMVPRTYYSLAVIVGLVVVLFSCDQPDEIIVKKELDQLVDPFIGTGGHGHTFPGATSPFGMVQLSPDTRLTGWDGCSGYHYTDSVIYGFSHTHLSGTGVSDYGDILIMPVNNASAIWSADLKYSDYQSPFLHSSEKATAGQYSVFLDRPQVRVDLSTTPRGGVHRYTFEQTKEPAIVIDLEHRDEVISCDLKVVSQFRVEGHRRSRAWASDQRLFFVIEFSKPILEERIVQTLDNKEFNSKGIFKFEKDLSEVEVKVALSAVDIEGARENFEKELADFDFESICKANVVSWQKELGKIRAEFQSKNDQILFYTALYHSMIAPNLYSDVDSRYRDMDQQVYTGEDHDHFTVFSLWDTYRATHPLYTIIDQERTNAFIGTMLRKYQHGGILPIWDLSACYTGCMIGYHGVSVIADAYVKGIREYNTDLALTAMTHSAEQDHLGLNDYKSNGFISVENEAESVSKTLEYAYDDWCIAQMAKGKGQDEIYERFIKRSLNYRNLYDPKSKFFRPRKNNFWLSPFDPYEVNSNYTEANAWHYAFSAVHDMSGFSELHGGLDSLDKFLDKLFTARSETSGRDQADITGLIGQYAHGNEPSHHIAYLYNYVGKPWKTQSRVREILSTQYRNAPDGISGNEDCGQMSAWYVLGALGIYSVTPGSPYYTIGSPLIKHATIDLENGNQFEIKVEGGGAEHVYIQSVTLNGESLERSYILHEEFMKGGLMVFEMGSNPNHEWAASPEHFPPSGVHDAELLSPPFISKGDLSFEDSMNIAFGSLDDAEIYASLNGGDYTLYTGRDVTLTTTSVVCIYAQNGALISDTICTKVYRVESLGALEILSEYAPHYTAGGDNALINGLRGARDYRAGEWQGYQGQDLEVILKMNKEMTLSRIACGFLQDENSWIFFPKEVEFYHSDDGREFDFLGRSYPSHGPEEKGSIIETIGVDFFPINTKYLKMVAKGWIDCPAWHKGAEHNGKAWIFADELILN